MSAGRTLFAWHTRQQEVRRWGWDIDRAWGPALPLCLGSNTRRMLADANLRR